MLAPSTESVYILIRSLEQWYFKRTDKLMKIYSYYANLLLINYRIAITLRTRLISGYIWRSYVIATK